MHDASPQSLPDLPLDALIARLAAEGYRRADPAILQRWRPSSICRARISAGACSPRRTAKAATGACGRNSPFPWRGTIWPAAIPRRRRPSPMPGLCSVCVRASRRVRPGGPRILRSRGCRRRRCRDRRANAGERRDAGPCRSSRQDGRCRPRQRSPRRAGDSRSRAPPAPARRRHRGGADAPPTRSHRPPPEPGRTTPAMPDCGGAGRPGPGGRAPLRRGHPCHRRAEDRRRAFRHRHRRPVSRPRLRAREPVSEAAAPWWATSSP